MCHNSIVENEQIEKCIENGMPKKIIKTIQQTIRKRAANEEQQQQQQLPSTSYQNNKKLSQPIQMSEKSSNLFISKCPFGHGKFTTPSSSTINNYFNTPNFTMETTTNNLYERFPQISQMNTATSSAAAPSLDNVNSNSITNLSGHLNDAVNVNGNNDAKLLSMGHIYNEDILAKSTKLTRDIAYIMQQALKKFQSSKIYTLLTQTTQPAHLVAIAIVTFVLLTIWPELIDGSNNNNNGSSQQQQYHQHSHQQTLAASSVTNVKQEMSVRKNDMLALIAYLGAFSTHFGAQIWMTFVSGLSLYFSLPRHMFGQCQQILFPKYFAMNAALSISMLIIYVKFFLNTWTLANCMQLGSLALTGIIELTVRLYLAPPLLRLMHEKYKIEGTVGSGKEIGSLVQGDLVKCPHYQRIHKAFRRIHMTVAIGNMFTMAASCLQLYYLAGQLQLTIVN